GGGRGHARPARPPAAGGAGLGAAAGRSGQWRCAGPERPGADRGERAGLGPLPLRRRAGDQPTGDRPAGRSRRPGDRAGRAAAPAGRCLPEHCGREECGSRLVDCGHRSGRRGERATGRRIAPALPQSLTYSRNTGGSAMSISPIRTITRREVNDTLTDWRILVPIFILSFVLPEILIAAANFAVRFVGDQATISRLVPFVMLLVGFIPASFSLITALETFVGERERNSLEALLSMPISDNQLYLGKLISSLLPPLLSSYTAMVVFAIS